MQQSIGLGGIDVESRTGFSDALLGTREQLASVEPQSNRSRPIRRNSFTGVGDFRRDFSANISLPPISAGLGHIGVASDAPWRVHL
jgi:hypothetical protein